MSDESHPLEAYFTGSREVSNRELFYVMVGIVLGELFESVPEPHFDLEGTRIWGTMGRSNRHYCGLINDTIRWLVEEGLVRENPQKTKGAQPGYVLTSKGLSLMQTKPDDPIGSAQESIGDTLSKYRGKAADATVSAVISQTVRAIIRLLGL